MGPGRSSGVPSPGRTEGSVLKLGLGRDMAYCRDRSGDPCCRKFYQVDACRRPDVLSHQVFINLNLNRTNSYPTTNVLLSNLSLVILFFSRAECGTQTVNTSFFAIGAHPWPQMFQEFACASCYPPTMELLIQPQSPCASLHDVRHINLIANSS